jgi:hypothetical protein
MPRAFRCALSQTSAKDLVEPRHQHVAVLHAGGLGRIARVLHELGMLERGAAALPQRVVGDAEREVGVGGPEHLVGDDRGVLVAAAARLVAGAEIDAGLVGEQRGHRILHGDLDLLAALRAVTRQ